MCRIGWMTLICGLTLGGPASAQAVVTDLSGPKGGPGFEKWDRNGDGVIDRTEFRQATKRIADRRGGLHARDAAPHGRKAKGRRAAPAGDRQLERKVQRIVRQTVREILRQHEGRLRKMHRRAPRGDGPPAERRRPHGFAPLAGPRPHPAFAPDSDHGPRRGPHGQARRGRRGGGNCCCFDCPHGGRGKAGRRGPGAGFDRPHGKPDCCAGPHEKPAEHLRRRGRNADGPGGHRGLEPRERRDRERGPQKGKRGERHRRRAKPIIAI